VYLSELDPEALRVLTHRKVVDYLRVRRGAALARGDYVLEVQEGRYLEVVTPERPDGMRVPLAAQPTLWGRIEFALYVAPRDGTRRRVAVVGRAGTTIIDDLASLDEFESGVWASDQVAGQIVFEALQQSAGRRAILRDRDAFPLLVQAVRSIEATVETAVERVAREVDAQTADRLSDAVRRIFSRVLRELADIDNPMRTPVGSEEGEGALFDMDRRPLPFPPSRPGGGRPFDPDATSEPWTDQLPPRPEPSEPPDPRTASPERAGGGKLPSIAPDPTPTEARSRFDEESGVVFYNDRHSDYLLVKEDDGGLLDYLASLVAKEYVVYNNPRATTAELGEEMIRMLVRVRRHLRTPRSGAARPRGERP
jgi:hypothetical protein